MSNQNDKPRYADANDGHTVEMNPGDEAPYGSPGSGENVCPDCKGTGRAGRGACSNCGGSGKVVEGIGGA